MLFAPEERYGNLVVVEPRDDISSDPLDVTVRVNELSTVVFAPVEMDSAVVQSDVEMVSVDAVVRLLTIVNVG
jgi:hypothetical protein